MANSIHIFTMKPPSSLTSTKLKTLFKTFLLSHVHPISHALGKAKSFLLKLANDAHITIHFPDFPITLIKRKGKTNNNKQKTKKLFFGSFRLHYNWCSSHVTPLGHETYGVKPTPFDDYYHHQHEDELSGYLQWLEEKKGNGDERAECNEIDKLADLFIADCHEKFRLEKQESYRRFQEMMARSV